MNWATLAGLGLFTVGLVGYTAGVSIEYPGRSFSITAIMVGLTLALIARQQATEEHA